MSIWFIDLAAEMKWSNLIVKPVRQGGAAEVYGGGVRHMPPCFKKIKIKYSNGSHLGTYRSANNFKFYINDEK